MNDPQNTAQGPMTPPDEKEAAIAGGLPVQAEAAPRSRWKSFLFALRLIEIRLRFIAILVAFGLVIGFWDTLENYWDHWTRSAAAAGAGVGDDTEFFCPMTACGGYTREGLEPDGSIPKCPVCGMQLSKRKKGKPVELPPGVVGRVQFSPDRLRLAGVQTAEARLQPLVHKVRTLGVVTYDESRRVQIVTRVRGYVEKLYVNKSFTDVEQGQKLAEIYSPDLYAAAQELLIARGSPDLVSTGREKLRLLGIDEAEINQIVQTGRAPTRLAIRSPSSGRVIRKEVLEGANIESGQLLFEVADLSHVWVEADVYEKDVAWLRDGQGVTVAVEGYPDEKFPGKVSLVYPELQTATRTARVRFELENRKQLLRAGMYATVMLDTPLQQMEPFKTILANHKQPATASDEQLIALQEVCPVTGARLGSMGKPVRDKAGDYVVFLCCAGCSQQLHERPDYYLSRMHTVTDSGVLAVPVRAVIDTGDQQIVYLQREAGVYDGVLVKLGPKAGEFYPVIEGLLPGDRVAAAGAFLVDAETRLNPAARAAYFGASGSSGETGSQPSRTTPSAGASPKKPSADDLKNVAQLPAADRTLATAQQVCPVGEEPLGSMGVPFKINLNGETVFLCCEGCEAKARRDAAGVVKRIRDLRGRRPVDRREVP